MILRPTPSIRWGISLFFASLAGGILGLGIRSWIGGYGDLWFPTVYAAILVALAALFWSMYIRVDDTSIVVKLAWARRYDRREVASMSVPPRSWIPTRSGRPVRFLRSDGSALFTTQFDWWGTDQLAALAAYLGVPVQLS